jgi:hypothetical protein
MAPSIKKCLLAMCFDEDALYCNLFVYEPIDYSKLIVLHNHRVVSTKFIHDSHITKEHWIINKTIMKYVGLVKIKNMKRVLYYEHLKLQSMPRVIDWVLEFNFEFRPKNVFPLLEDEDINS